MEPAEATLSPRRRVTILLQVFTVLVVAEILLVYSNLTADVLFSYAALLADLVLVFALPVLASRIVPRDRALASLLGALVLVPLLRVVSLATPFDPASPILWLALVSVALLFASGAIMYAQGLRPLDVFLGIGRRRFFPLNVGLAVVGFLLGSLEFQILHPAPCEASPCPNPVLWSGDPGTEPFLIAVVVVFVATGVVEELIFRGILLRTSIRVLGRRSSLVYVTLVFTALHVGFLSAAELLFVFFLGLLFGVIVLVTESLWGAAVAHTTANVALYLILPFSGS
jgi:hypothetical protein